MPTRREILATALAAVAASAKASEIRLPDRVRVGIIGLDGHFGEAVKAARLYPQIRIVAVETSTGREERRAAGSKELAEARRYGDYRKLLDSEELDAVMICDQNWRRAETVAACLERKIPTAAEKPIALSMAELAHVETAARETRTPLTMLLPMRFDPRYLAMRAIVESGAIGEAAQLSGQKSYQLGERPDWMLRRETFGGTIPYIACHVVDLLRFISGREFVETAAFHGTVGRPEGWEMENTCAISYRLDNGGTAGIRLDYLRPKAGPSHGDDRIRIAGLQGIAECQGGKVTLVTDEKEPHEVTSLPEGQSLFADFLDSVYNGMRHSISVGDVFRVTRIVLRSRDAADQRRTLSI